MGRGFATGDENKVPDMPIGVIPIDSIFSPVTRVKYSVQNTRVGQMTDYDKLILEVWTDGRIAPRRRHAPGFRHSAPSPGRIRQL